MRLRQKCAAFLRLSAFERRLVGEAALTLALARLLVLTMPLRLIVPLLQRAPETGLCDEQIMRAVRRAITIAARNVPWNAACLPQALAAKAMLARRGYGSAFHLGATFDKNGRVVAHAWLAAGGEVVVGAAGIHGMSLLARFG